MKALLLSAGFGTRLRPMTFTVPKCMVNICGKPVLERQLDYLAYFGIKDVVINLHYLAPQVYQYFGHKFKDTNVVYLYEKELLGEEGTIQAAQPWLGKEFVIMNGDTLTDLKLNELIESASMITRYGEDNGIYTGIKVVYGNNYGNVFPYRKKFWWCDIGSHEELRRARKYYA